MNFVQKATLPFQNLRNKLKINYGYAGLYENDEDIFDAIWIQIEGVKYYCRRMMKNPMDANMFQKMKTRLAKLESTLAASYEIGGQYGRLIANGQIRGYAAQYAQYAATSRMTPRHLLVDMHTLETLLKLLNRKEEARLDRSWKKLREAMFKNVNGGLSACCM